MTRKIAVSYLAKLRGAGCLVLGLGYANIGGLFKFPLEPLKPINQKIDFALCEPQSVLFSEAILIISSIALFGQHPSGTVEPGRRAPVIFLWRYGYGVGKHDDGLNLSEVLVIKHGGLSSCG